MNQFKCYKVSSFQGLKNRKYRPIFRVSAHLDTIFPSDCRSGETSAFYRFFWRNFGDISVFYRFFPIFPEISVTVHESVLFTTVHKSATVHQCA